MSFPRSRSWVVMISAIVLASAGCGGRPPRVEAPAINPSGAGTAAVKLYDTNGDGTIGGEELDKSPVLKKTLERIDRNGDGAIDAKEIADRIREWQSLKLGQMAISCTVTRNDEPVAGATVTFVPEPFLGDQMQTATGVTNDFGVARLTMPNDSQGVAPGFYSVRITKDGEEIPAKYNSETVLGQEVSVEANESEDELVYEIE